MAGPSDPEWRVKALEQVLVEKGYVDPAALDVIAETYEHHVGPHNGARVVARAWCDPEYRAWLLEDATAAVAALGYSRPGRRGRSGPWRTRRRSTTSSCARCAPATPGRCSASRRSGTSRRPTAPGSWSTPAASWPSSVSNCPPTTEIRVWDSTSEIRYLVVPVRPDGTDGWSEEDLARLVTRDSMIGTGLPKRPEDVTR